MCKPRLSTQLLIPIRKNTQTCSTFMSGQITGTITPFTTSTILHLSELNVERDLPTHFNTIYTGYFNEHSSLCGYHDHNSTTWHIIEDMFTASNLIFMWDETTTPTLYHRSIGTMSIPYLNLVAADSVNKTQVNCSRRHRKRSQTNTHPTHLQNNAASTYMGMEKELHGWKLGYVPRNIRLTQGYKACSSENALTRTTEKSVMPSKPLPSNP